jgi:hypothetical protein
MVITISKQKPDFMKRFSLLWGMSCSLIITAFLAGCGTPPATKHAVELVPRTDASVEVDFVGATGSDLMDWKAYSMNKYWQPGDPMRRDAEKVTLRIDGKETKQFAPNDPIWDKWFARQATYLVVLAHLPGDFPDGPTDPRRKIVPLAAIEKNQPLQIEIQERRIMVVTPLKTLKNARD